MGWFGRDDIDLSDEDYLSAERTNAAAELYSRGQSKRGDEQLSEARRNDEKR